MLRNTRFCTFGKEKRGFLNKKENIGPEKYDPKMTLIKKKNPEWSFGISKRDRTKENNIPGPGKYNFTGTNSKKMGKIGKDKRKDLNLSKNPGPGTYKNESLFEQNLKKKKGTSLYSKNNRNKIIKGPCPGDYNCPSIFDKNKMKKKGFSLSKSLRNNDKNFNKVPGPGMYDINNKKKKKFKGGKFGIQKRSKIKDNKVPGPGNYKFNSTIAQNVPKWSFGKTKKNKKSATCIGPFFYDSKIDAIKTNAPKWSFSKEKGNESLKKKERLGPGAYEIPVKRDKKGGKFGTDSKNKKNNEKNNTPGPGSYKNKSTVVIKNNLGNFLVSKNFKNSNLKFDNKLGPGAYSVNVDPIKKRTASCKFGKSKNGFYKENDIPGCGTYNPKTDFIFSKAPICKFGTGKNRAEAKNSHIPGPGQYKTKNLLEKKNKFSFGAKLLKNERLNSPGPGKYNPINNLNILKPNSKISGKFGNDKKLKDNDKNKIPSPGHYYKDNDFNKLNKGKNIVFGKDTRSKKKKKKKTPYFYDIKSCFEENVNKKKGPSLSFKTNLVKANMNNPGPGTYNVDDDKKNNNILISTMKNSAKCVFSKNGRFNENGNKKFSEVGPGKYENKTIFDVKNNNKKSYLGKNKRFKMKKNLNPGPGDYELISTFQDIPKHIKDQIKFKIAL